MAVEARWRARDGPVRTGELFGTADVAAGHSTRIWVDRTGQLVRRGLDRRRMAAWDADWLANGPRWSPRR